MVIEPLSLASPAGVTQVLSNRIWLSIGTTSDRSTTPLPSTSPRTQQASSAPAGDRGIPDRTAQVNNSPAWLQNERRFDGRFPDMPYSLPGLPGPAKRLTCRRDPPQGTEGEGTARRNF